MLASMGVMHLGIRQDLCLGRGFGQYCVGRLQVYLPGKGTLNIAKTGELVIANNNR